MNRVLLGVALALSIGACAVSLTAPPFWGIAAAAVVASLARTSLGPRIGSVFAFFTWIALIATAIVTWSLVVVLMIHGDSTELTLRVLAAVLAGCGIGLLLARRDGFVLVTIVALLDLAGTHRHQDLRPFLLSATLAVLLHLVRPQRPRRALAVGATIGIGIGIAATLPPAQRAVEKAAFEAFAPTSARSGLSGDDAQLGEVESLSTSDRLVLRVWSERPERLRARVYVKFDGRTWHVARADGGLVRTVDPTVAIAPQARSEFPGALHALESTKLDALAGDDVRSTRIVPIDLDDGLLPSPGAVIAVKAPFAPMIDAFGVLMPLGRANDPWVVLHHDQPQIADDRAPDAALRASTLSVPKLDPRIVAVAGELAHGTPEERVRNTVEWVRNAARYDLNVGAFKTRDPVAEFLFEKKRGYCEYFATSLALLLRLEGVPSRFVTGFNVGSENKVGEHYEVHDADAHAWVEAYVEGRGWIVADATPPGDYLLVHPHAPSRIDAIRAYVADVWVSLRHGGRRGVLRGLGYVALAALFAAGIVVVVREIRRRRAGEGTEKQGERAELPQSLSRLVEAIDRAFEALGRPRPRAIGLLEHALTFDDPTNVATLRAAIELAHRAAFAGESVDDDTLLRATRSVAAMTRTAVR